MSLFWSGPWKQGSSVFCNHMAVIWDRGESTGAGKQESGIQIQEDTRRRVSKGLGGVRNLCGRITLPHLSGLLSKVGEHPWG